MNSGGLITGCVALAPGMGVDGERVETAQRFNAVLAAALKGEGSFVIEARI